MSTRRRRLPKGAYPLPEGGWAVNKDGVPHVVGTGKVRIDPDYKAHPNMKLFAKALLRLVEDERADRSRRSR